MRISDWSSDVCSSDLRAYSIAPALKRSLSLSLAEQRRSDPHMGGAKPDGCLEIAGHAHRQPIEPVFAGKLGEQRKERRWLYFRRGDGHQPHHRQDEIGRASWRERVCPYV